MPPRSAGLAQPVVDVPPTRFAPQGRWRRSQALPDKRPTTVVDSPILRRLAAVIEVDVGVKPDEFAHPDPPLAAPPSAAKADVAVDIIKREAGLSAQVGRLVGGRGQDGVVYLHHGVWIVDGARVASVAFPINRCEIK